MKTTIKNLQALSTNSVRADALAIAEVGFAAAAVDDAVKKKIRVENGQLHINDATYRLAGRQVFFVGVGKCALRGARAIGALLGEALSGGIVLDVSVPDGAYIPKMEIYVGTHPLPTEVNERASKRILEFLSGHHEDDLVIMLISGGGSSLLCLHDTHMTCADETTLFETLTAHGAPIQDINIVRKHISRARGGALAAAAYPAEIVSLIVSDVPGDDLATIASGPTILDSSTIADAQAVLERYGISPSGRVTFRETPKEKKYFIRVTNTLFLSNRDALTSMQEEAVRRGYTTHVVEAPFAGEARKLGRAIVEKLHDSATKTALLYAGESTVTLEARAGKGGRNQEMALAALMDIHDDELILPFASDGHDNTEHAGAIADKVTKAHATEKNLSMEEYLNAHRSYDFFTAADDALTTGYTGSNVSDLIIALKN
ncbi:DUF4147 domain-containing protein [Candidatus Parcubacteria bacterium]|nr:DUF4147 domain-containing protein [Candidatus Parcubacteria bacterium]